jgi:hypothetical protein
VALAAAVDRIAALAAVAAAEAGSSRSCDESIESKKNK